MQQLKKELSQDDKAVYPNIAWVTKASNNSLVKQKNPSQNKYLFEARCEINLSQEESSIKSNHSVIKNTPQETKLIKSPLSYLDKRHKDIQQEFNFKPESKPPNITKTSEFVNQKFDKSWIEILRKSPDKPVNFSSKSPGSKYNSQAQQVIVSDCSIDTINYTSDENSEWLQKQLNYNTADESLKYRNEICQNEWISKGMLKIPQIQILIWHSSLAAII